MKIWMKKGMVVFGLLVLAAFLRLYRIDEYMTFLGDEGRDALVVKDILVNHHFPLLGPPTSVGNMYLGPLYYYMMAISMSIWWLNPVAASVMVALIGVATVGLVYYLGNKFWGFWPGVISALLYCWSPITIYYSRSSWNPNQAPFFALLSLIGFLKSKETKNFLWLVLSGVSLAFANQMHYLALLLLPTGVIVWFYLTRMNSKKNFRVGTALALLSFFLLMSPVVIFDFRHNFMNYHAVKNFFFGSNSSINGNFLDIILRIWNIASYNLVGRYLSLENPLLYFLLAALLLIVLGSWLVKSRVKDELQFFHFYLTIWMIVGVTGLAILRQPVYDHYLGFLNPVPFLLVGGTFVFVKSNFAKWRFSYMFIPAFVGLILINSMMKNPFRNYPNRQLQNTQEIARFIIENSQNGPFNFALIAQNNYDAAYQFYLDVYGHQPKKLPFEKTEQLYVVCEDAVCNPVGHPKFEIAAFGMARIEKSYQIKGVKIYRLIANPNGVPS